MPRQKNLIPPALVHLSLPSDVVAKMSLALFSPLEQRIPHGAMARYITELIKLDQREERLDLAPWAGTPPGAFILHGSPEAIATLTHMLKGKYS